MSGTITARSRASMMPSVLRSRNEVLSGEVKITVLRYIMSVVLLGHVEGLTLSDYTGITDCDKMAPLGMAQPVSRPSRGKDPTSITTCVDKKN